MNFNKGNAVKYITRSGFKSDEIQDLEKAAWYIAREISRVKKLQEIYGEEQFQPKPCRARKK